MSLKRAIHSRLRRMFQSGPVEELVQAEANTPSESPSLKRPTRSFEDFFAHLKDLGFDPSICIDVGAATGTLSIYEAFPNSTHYAFEPLPDFQEGLKETLSSYAHVAKDCALSDATGASTLLKHPDLFGSTIMHQHEDSDERLVKIKTSTLDIEMSGVDLKGPVLLKTDCQGSDLLALKGGIETLAQCDVVIVEASFFRFWGAHQPDIYDIVAFMKSQGFSLYDLLDGLYRPLDSALGQIDLAFVKDDGNFRRRHYW